MEIIFLVYDIQAWVGPMFHIGSNGEKYQKSSNGPATKTQWYLTGNMFKSRVSKVLVDFLELILKYKQEKDIYYYIIQQALGDGGVKIYCLLQWVNIFVLNF